MLSLVILEEVCPNVLFSFCITSRQLSFYIYNFRLIFGLLVQLVCHVNMTDPLHSSSPAPLNSLLDLNLNINMNLKTPLHDVAYNVKY